MLDDSLATSVQAVLSQGESQADRNALLAALDSLAKISGGGLPLPLPRFGDHLQARPRTPPTGKAP